MKRRNFLKSLSIFTAGLPFLPKALQAKEKSKTVWEPGCVYAPYNPFFTAQVLEEIKKDVQQIIKNYDSVDNTTLCDDLILDRVAKEIAKEVDIKFIIGVVLQTKYVVQNKINNFIVTAYHKDNKFVVDVDIQFYPMPCSYTRLHF